MTPNITLYFNISTTEIKLYFAKWVISYHVICAVENRTGLVFFGFSNKLELVDQSLTDSSVFCMTAMIPQDWSCCSDDRFEERPGPIHIS